MSQRNDPLGDFLRTRRARLQPRQAGLPEAARRRTPGLRRDEVAALAGISVEWYVKLEQGRAVRPSGETLAALARALQLSEAETQHLLRLGRGRPGAAFQPETVPDALLTFLRSLAQPAWVTGLRWDILAWNRAAEGVLGDLLNPQDLPPNLLRQMMLDPRARALFGAGWNEEARRMLSLFRAVHDDHAGDPAFEALAPEIREGSEEFRLWWRDHEIAAPASGRKVLYLPGAGPATFDYLSLQSNDDPGLRLSILTPV